MWGEVNASWLLNCMGWPARSRRQSWDACCCNSVTGSSSAAELMPAKQFTSKHPMTEFLMVSSRTVLSVDPCAGCGSSAWRLGKRALSSHSQATEGKRQRSCQNKLAMLEPPSEAVCLHTVCKQLQQGSCQASGHRTCVADCVDGRANCSAVFCNPIRPGTFLGSTIEQDDRVSVSLSVLLPHLTAMLSIIGLSLLNSGCVVVTTV
jgi:hypothetical protein